MDEIEVEVLGTQVGERLVESRFNVFGGMEEVPKLKPQYRSTEQSDKFMAKVPEGCTPWKSTKSGPLECHSTSTPFRPHLRSAME